MMNDRAIVDILMDTVGDGDIEAVSSIKFILVTADDNTFRPSLKMISDLYALGFKGSRFYQFFYDGCKYKPNVFREVMDAYYKGAVTMVQLNAELDKDIKDMIPFKDLIRKEI